LFAYELTHDIVGPLGTHHAFLIALEENDMADNNDTKTRDPVKPHMAARPMKFVKDKEGNGWLCDKDVDVSKDLRQQGCWRCDEMAFPTGGR
jgi:hypothetical protein